MDNSNSENNNSPLGTKTAIRRLAMGFTTQPLADNAREIHQVNRTEDLNNNVHSFIDLLWGQLLKQRGLDRTTQATSSREKARVYKEIRGLVRSQVPVTSVFNTYDDLFVMFSEENSGERAPLKGGLTTTQLEKLLEQITKKLETLLPSSTAT